jgi:hypothetical protein
VQNTPKPKAKAEGNFVQKWVSQVRQSLKGTPHLAGDSSYANVETRTQVRMTVPCPACGAETGEQCVGSRPTRNGRPYVRIALHQERWQKARLGKVESTLRSA